MNIQDLQSSLQGYNQSVAENVDRISDKIGDIRSNIQEGMSVPLIAGGLTGGLREGGKITSKAGKKLVGVADRLKGRSQMTSNLDENTGAVFKQTPNPSDFRELERYPNGDIVDLYPIHHLLTDRQKNRLTCDDFSRVEEYQAEIEFELHCLLEELRTA